MVHGLFEEDSSRTNNLSAISNSLAYAVKNTKVSLVIVSMILVGVTANAYASVSGIDKAEENIVPINLGIEVPDVVEVMKGESVQIPVTVTIPANSDSNVKIAIVADGEDTTFSATGQAVLPEGFSALRTGSESWRGTNDSVHLKIFFELTASWDVSPGSYTLAAVSSGQNTSVAKFFKVNVLNNPKIGFTKTNVTEIYRLKGNYYTLDRELEYQDFKVPYRISNGTLEQIKVDQLNESVVVDINSTGNGELEIDMPRNLFDQKSNFTGDLIDDNFLVLIDGMEVEFVEHKTKCFRNLLINFTEKTKEIGIVGVNYLTGPEPFASDVLPIYLATNNNNYTRGDKIAIFGCTSLGVNGEKMVFDIADHEERSIKNESITLNLDGTFLYELETESGFTTNGDYTIRATYGNNTNTRTVTVPEFPIAGFILVASMITILAITKTKWNLGPARL